MSRRDRPKQLVPFIGGRSLLRLAADRARAVAPTERLWVCAAERHREPIREALDELDDERLLGEPTGRDTAAAIGLTAAVLARRDPNAVFAVLTADHLIEPMDVFADRVNLGFRLAEDDPSRLVTFSIKPTYPATGFGYVERGEAIERIGDEQIAGAFRVARFVEKPDERRAREYIESGRFSWNSGMFVWRAETLLEALGRFKPEIHEGVTKIAEAWDSPKRTRTLEEVYPNLPKTSIDYAVMEPASTDENFDVCTVVMDLDWRDVGSWNAYAETLTPDESGNRVQDGADGERTTLVDCENTTVVGEATGRRIAVLGARGLTIVETPDATLVVPADQADRLKDLHGELPDEVK